MADLTKLCYGCMEHTFEEFGCTTCGYIKDSSQTKHTLKTGTKIGDRYIVGKLERNDGEGNVYIGYDTTSDKKVSIREFAPSTLCTRDPKNNRVLIKEHNQVEFDSNKTDFIELSKKLYRHKKLESLIPIIDIFEQNNTAYAIYEYVVGVSLGEFMTKNSPVFSWEQAQFLFFPVLNSLCVLHSDSIFHFGISPFTIIINTNGDLLLTDFLISPARMAKSHLTGRMYTGYCAPELYSMTNWNGSWSDIYSISAVLYYCLTGIVPQDAQQRMKNDALVKLASLNPAIPDNVNFAISSGMLLAPDKRCENAADFLAILSSPPLEYEEKNKELMDTISNQKVKLDTREGVIKTVAKPAPKKDSKPKKKVKKRSVVPYYFYSLLISLVLLLGTSFLYFDTIAEALNINFEPPKMQVVEQDNNGSTVDKNFKAPNLLGKTLDEIKAMPDYITHFKLVEEHEYHANTPSGEVYEQSIPAGSTSDTKMVIKVKVSLGIKPIPNFVGTKLENAQFYLDQNNIPYIVEHQPSDTYDEGEIISITQIGGNVSIIVSEGSEGEEVGGPSAGDIIEGDIPTITG